MKLVMRSLPAILPALFGLQPALAQAPSAQPLIEMQDVDRDRVPAGTPAAFEVAFPNAQRNEAIRSVGEDEYSFVPLAFIPLSDSRIALVSTGANECTGHACAGLNAVHYLDHPAGRPQAPYAGKGEWLDVGATGTLGNPARQWGWTPAIAAHPVLVTMAGGSWAGRHCDYTVLNELTPAGPVEIARFQSAFSDTTTEDSDPGVEGVITAAQQGKSFTVSYTGSARFSETYTKGSDGKFRLSGKSKVPAC